MDASDDSSSSSDEGNFAALQAQQQQRRQHRRPPAPTTTNHSKYYRTNSDDDGNVDLEQILREDEDDDDDSNEDDSNDNSNTFPSRSSRSGNNIWDSRTTLSDDDDEDNHKNGMSAYPPSSLTTTSTAHNPEEWDVLQAILGEDDDDDDDSNEERGAQGDFHLGDSSHRKHHPEDDNSSDWIQAQKIKSSHVVHNNHFRSSNNHNNNVDAILQSDEEDDDDGDEINSRDGTNNRVSSNFIRPEDDDDDMSDLESPSEIMMQGGGSSPIQKQTQKQQQIRSKKLLPKLLVREEDLQPEEELTEASKKSLAFARAYEKKLLRSGHRDIVSPLMVKRRLRPKIELDTRMQRKRNDAAKELSSSSAHKTLGNDKDRFAVSVAKASSSSSATRFNFSGVVENKTMQGVSAQLMKKTKGKNGEPMVPDLPTALAVNSRFIAAGTQRGIVLVFDLFEVLRQRLGATVQPDSNFNPRTAGSVTTVDLSSMNGEVLVAGYTSGMIVLWDVIKGAILRTVNETQHPSPITTLRFLNDLKLVSVDASGVVNKLNFSKNIFGNYSVDSECLLDGTAGQILAMNALEPFAAVGKHLSNEPVHPSVEKLILVALSSERSSFAVAVEPSVHVLHRWARPPPERMEPPASSGIEMNSGQVYLPCLSWGWALISGGGNTISPILARAWGCCMQLLRASFPEGENNLSQEIFQWPAFGIHDEFDADAPVVALEWLSERSMVYLTVTNEFTVIDTVMMTLLERLDFSGIRLVYAEFSLSRTAKDVSEGRRAAKAYCTTFQNSFRSRDKRLFVLCQEEMKSVSIVGAKRRISALEEDGEWLEALALALDHYENTIKSQEDRRRDQTGFRDLSKHPEFNSVTKSEDEEWIAKLLIRYLTIAVDNAPETSPRARGSESDPIFDLAHSHFQMLAGVCVEFCVVTRRLDLLFGPIFRRFNSAGFVSVFLDVLEPYILNDKLDYIAPEAMAHFVEHCRLTNGIATVERCLLHMDVTIMDFDSILSLLRANEMYSALFYVFNRGLDDFTTPLEILMERIFDAADTGNITVGRRLDGVPQNDFERYGYKAIMYLQSCFKGKTFPQDTDIQPEEKLHVLRPQLLKFLLQEQFSPSGNIRKPSEVFGQRSVRYPYTHILLMVDPKVMFETMSLALDAPDNEFGRADANFASMGGWEVEDGDGLGSNGRDPSPERQEIIAMFTSIILPEKDDIVTTHQTTLYQSKIAVNAFLDFLAVYLMKGVVQANKSVTFMILERMSARYGSSTDPSERAKYQKEIIQLVTALPRSSYDAEEVLVLVQKAGIHRAALLLHQEGASSWNEGNDDIQRRAEHFRCAADCYLEDTDEDFRKEVFAYARKECTGSSDTTFSEISSRPKSLRDALVSKLTDLVRLDALRTAELVAELFVDDVDLVVKALEADDGGEAQFLFLQAIVSGELNQIDPVADSVLNAHLSMEHHHKYLALMAKLHPELVYDYLSTHDNYRPEECLKLCQDYDIADASAYLLERMGNISSALQLILQTLESRMMALKRTIRGMGTDFFRSQTNRSVGQRYSKKKSSTTSAIFGKQQKEVDGVKRILVVALDLCERNSGTFSNRTEQGSQLWFNVLDRLINAKGFLRLSKEQPGHAKAMNGVLSDLLRMTMQRMVSSVPLPDLVRKVTSDHSGSRLGELREMIDSLLSTYGLEENVFDGAVNVFRFDVQKMKEQNRSLRVSGKGVRSVMNMPLDKENTLQNKEALTITSNRGDVFELSETGNATLVDASRVSRSHATEAGFGNALSRLRARRQNNKGSGLPTGQVRSTGLNFVTEEEQQYMQGESASDAYFFEERPVGALGDAEHYGRLMSFSYA